MNTFLKKQKGWLLPVVLILFILEVVTFPFVINFTWADRSESPNHILTYTQGNLTWSNTDGVDENGAARLSLFDTVYQNARSDDGSKIIAPGSSSNNIIRLKNSVGKPVHYTAVLYSIKSVEELPVKAYLKGENLADTQNYFLPDGVKSDDIIRAVSGTVGGGMIQDFDIGWNWDYQNSDVQDTIDTYLGNQAVDENMDITIGMYIVVEDGNTYTSPNTGADDAWQQPAEMGAYVSLMCISAVVLIFLIIDKRRDKKCRE
ncbi:MAG: hypothetical protein NC213_03375 [Acetobacter sp.]|nr:hypothetical protein [Bacteroides sp.]MCM1340764.1 hypothetical protein [Acetobacter sp.]MCM1432679.1 hypothetical protein [Clostridiales bacterium]